MCSMSIPCFYSFCPPWCFHLGPTWAELTHRGRVRHMCVGKLTTIASDNGLLPGRRQAIIWTNSGIMSIDQSHRYGRHQAACCEPAGSYDKNIRTAICFEHKTQYLLILAPYTRIVVFWHISNIPPWFRRVKLVVIPPRFILQQFLLNIAIQSAVGCYNLWAKVRCSGCYPLGEKLLWNRSIGHLGINFDEISSKIHTF